MDIQIDLTWKTAYQTADNLLFKNTGKHLSDLEIIILRGAWHNQTYEEIAEAQNYTSNYLSKDIGRKLWHNLSMALQEKVSKKNFKAALQRQCINYTHSPTEQVEFSRSENITFPVGAVALDSRFYITRNPLESICYETIAKPGSLIRIKGAKWSGKTSLINRILQQGNFQSQKTIYLNFDRLKRSIIQDSEKLLQWLCIMVARQLKLSSIEYDWDNKLDSIDNCTVYLKECVLAKTDNEIVIALDNLDRLLIYPEAIKSLLKMLRSWHEQAKVDPCWSKLKLIVSHSTQTDIFDIDQSPFNLGVPILLKDFSYEQVKTLASLYQLDLNEIEIEQLMNEVGGHPYLIRLAMYQISTQILTLENYLSNNLQEAVA